MAGVNSWHRDGFIVDHFEFYANRSSRASFCLMDYVGPLKNQNNTKGRVEAGEGGGFGCVG